MHAAIVGAFHLQVAPHAEAKILRYYRFYRFLGPLAQPPPPDGRHVASGCCECVLNGRAPSVVLHTRLVSCSGHPFPSTRI